MGKILIDQSIGQEEERNGHAAMVTGVATIRKAEELARFFPECGEMMCEGHATA
jgi:hypothetical protein